MKIPNSPFAKRFCDHKLRHSGVEDFVEGKPEKEEKRIISVKTLFQKKYYHFGTTHMEKLALFLIKQ